MPARADIDPLDLGGLLGNIALVLVRTEPPGFVYRVWPSNMVSYLGNEYQNKTVKDLQPPDYASAVEGWYEQVVASRRPLHARQRVITPWIDAIFEVIVLPLSNDGQTVNMLLSGAYPLAGET